MPLKCVETIYRLPQVGKEIVHPVGKPSDKVHHKYHNRDRHGFGHTAEPATSDRGSCDNYRSRDVRRPEELTLLTAGKAEQGGGSGNNNPGASFPIWGTI